MRRKILRLYKLQRGAGGVDATFVGSVSYTSGAPHHLPYFRGGIKYHYFNFINLTPKTKRLETREIVASL